MRGAEGEEEWEEGRLRERQRDTVEKEGQEGETERAEGKGERENQEEGRTEE